MEKTLPTSEPLTSEAITSWLRRQCGHDSRSVEGCGHCEAAEGIERLQKDRNECLEAFHILFRIFPEPK